MTAMTANARTVARILARLLIGVAPDNGAGQVILQADKQ